MVLSDTRKGSGATGEFNHQFHKIWFMLRSAGAPITRAGSQ
jgi:hypothetical protein